MEDQIVPIKDACFHNGEYSEAYPTGISYFDEAMKAPGGKEKRGGVRDGDLIIITGKSGEGKTTFMQNLALNFDALLLPSLFFTYENPTDDIYAKFKLMGLPEENTIFAPKVITTGNLAWIREKIAEAVNKYYVKIVFIDHIDFLSPADYNNSDQLRMRLKQITMELKNIARGMEIVIFLCAHVKKVEGREIEMQDIAESAGIYQNADYVISVARYKEDIKGDAVFTQDSKARMLKNRLNGKLAQIEYVIKDQKIARVCGKSE